jgi:hypothetical protein
MKIHEHHDEAERLLKHADWFMTRDGHWTDEERIALATLDVAKAQVHATLSASPISSAL